VTPSNKIPLIAKDNSAKLVIINKAKTDFDRFADHVINDKKIGDVIQELDIRN
jgi:NAD-dependent deacetylase